MPPYNRYAEYRPPPDHLDILERRVDEVEKTTAELVETVGKLRRYSTWAGTAIMGLIALQPEKAANLLAAVAAALRH